MGCAVFIFSAVTEVLMRVFITPKVSHNFIGISLAGFFFVLSFLIKVGGQAEGAGWVACKQQQCNSMRCSVTCSNPCCCLPRPEESVCCTSCVMLLAAQGRGMSAGGSLKQRGSIACCRPTAVRTTYT